RAADELTQAALDLVQIADVFEDFARGRWRLVMGRLVLGMTDQAAQVLAVGLWVVVDEALQHAVVAADEAIAPALQGMETLVVFAGGAVDLVDQGGDRLDVLVAHEL